MNTTLTQTLNHIEKRGLINDGATLIIGLSGGPDSMFLLHCLAQLKTSKRLTLIAAHLDHQWRPESANDVQFCAAQAEIYGISFVSKTLNQILPHISYNGSKEELGRKARRFFFASLVKEYNASGIALAHHADDQKETFFIRMLRGTSLSGLIGMKDNEKGYIRPLLLLSKQQILSYLEDQQIPFLIDPSNTSDAFLRNRIRNYVIPALQCADKRFDDHFSALHRQLVEAETYIAEQTKTAIATTIKDQTGTLDLSAFFSLPSLMQNRVIMQWLIMHNVPFTPSHGLIIEIIRFFKNPGNGSHIFYHQWSITKNNQTATISTIVKKGTNSTVVKQTDSL